MKTRSRWQSLCLSILLTGPAGHAVAQDGPEDIVIGERLTIFSATLDEERTIIVGKPFGYDDGEESYPVMVVLDGDAHFHHTTGLTSFLAFSQRMPGMLVVAVENTDRTRDMTPPTQEADFAERMPTNGGAANFRAFIADELIPWLDENYRTRPYRILVGHSFGGLFAIDFLVTRPDTFDGYIAISPSLQWNEQRLVDRAEAFFDATDELSASLFMTAGNEGGGLVGGIRKLSGVLEEKAPAGFAWHFEHMPQETHGSVPHRSTYQGLEFIFSDWVLSNPLETYNEYGIEAVERFYAARDEKYGYDLGVPEDALASIGISLREEGRLDELFGLLERYRDTIQAPPPFLVQLAGQFREAGRAEQAIELYRQVLVADPGNEPARQALTELGNDFSDLIE